MRKVVALALCFLALPATAMADGPRLQGQWSIEAPLLPGYTGMVLIDAEQRVIWDAPSDSGKPAKFQGYVASIDGPKIEIALTNRATVARGHCTLQSADILHCYFVFTHSDRVSAGFILRRTGPGPQKLAPILQ